MIGFVYSTGEDFGQIAVDFNEALAGGNEKGNIILLVSTHAIEPTWTFNSERNFSSTNRDTK